MISPRSGSISGQYEQILVQNSPSRQCRSYVQPGGSNGESHENCILEFLLGGSRQAVQRAYEQLAKRLGGTPDYLIVGTTVTHSFDQIAATLAELAPDVPVHGAKRNVI